MTLSGPKSDDLAGGQGRYLIIKLLGTSCLHVKAYVVVKRVNVEDNLPSSSIVFPRSVVKQPGSKVWEYS